MGHAARRNETAQAAKRGELLSRRSLMGAMDHALEMHAAALRLLEAKIVALKERIERMETVLHVTPAPTIPPVALAMVVHSAQPCGCDAGAGWTCEQHRSADV